VPPAACVPNVKKKKKIFFSLLCVALPLLLAVVSHKGNSLYRRPLWQRFKARSERFFSRRHIGGKNLRPFFHFAQWNLALRKSLIYFTVRTSREAVAPPAQKKRGKNYFSCFCFRCEHSNGPSSVHAKKKNVYP
jgi:hypothetical protein